MNTSLLHQLNTILQLRILQFRSEIARHHDGTVFNLRDFYPVSQDGGVFSSLHHQHIGFCFVLFFKSPHNTCNSLPFDSCCSRCSIITGLLLFLLLNCMNSFCILFVSVLLFNLKCFPNLYILSFV